MSKDCKHYDAELDCCKLLSYWSEAMPVLQPCIDGPCDQFVSLDKEKQIEEIAEDMYNALPDYEHNYRDCRSAAEVLYNAGYRKQSEGEWTYNRGYGHGESPYYCSVCIEGESEYGADSYCPNCGARMKGG